MHLLANQNLDVWQFSYQTLLCIHKSMLGDRSWDGYQGDDGFGKQALWGPVKATEYLDNRRKSEKIYDSSLEELSLRRSGWLIPRGSRFQTDVRINFLNGQPAQQNRLPEFSIIRSFQTDDWMTVCQRCYNRGWVSLIVTSYYLFLLWKKRQKTVQLWQQTGWEIYTWQDSLGSVSSPLLDWMFYIFIKWKSIELKDCTDSTS